MPGTMRGMSHGATADNPALTLVRVPFMLGYVPWTVTGAPPVTDPAVPVAATASRAGAAGAARGL